MAPDAAVSFRDRGTLSILAAGGGRRWGICAERAAIRALVTFAWGAGVDPDAPNNRFAD